jgi:hypothetical protein
LLSRKPYETKVRTAGELKISTDYFEVEHRGKRKRGCDMDRAYDVFEILPDGSPLWRATVTGLGTAIRALNVREE